MNRPVKVDYKGSATPRHAAEMSHGGVCMEDQVGVNRPIGVTLGR